MIQREARPTIIPLNPGNMATITSSIQHENRDLIFQIGYILSLQKKIADDGAPLGFGWYETFVELAGDSIEGMPMVAVALSRTCMQGIFISGDTDVFDRGGCKVDSEDDKLKSAKGLGL